MHTLHVGYVGIILNIRYLELINFFVNWSGADLTGENHDPRGKWPWQSDYSGNLPERLRLYEAGAPELIPEGQPPRKAEEKAPPKEGKAPAPK